MVEAHRIAFAKEIFQMLNQPEPKIGFFKKLERKVMGKYPDLNGKELVLAAEKFLKSDAGKQALKNYHLNKVVPR